MKLIINGQEKTFKAPLKIFDLLEKEGYGDMMIAVAKNGTFVPKSTYGETELKDGDQIEIVAPMQGG